MSAVVVDTGVISAPLLARRSIGQALEQQYRRHLIGHQLVIAAQTLAELHYGAEVAGWGAARRRRLEQLTNSVYLVAPDEELCRRCAWMRAALRRAGHPLHQDDHTGDLWIAATAVHLGLPLVAHDGIFLGCPELDLRTELRPESVRR